MTRSIAIGIAFALAASQDAIGEPITVAVDLSKLDGATAVDAAALEKVLVVRMVQDGFAVVSAAQDPRVTVTLVDDGARLQVSVSTPAGFLRSRAVDLDAAAAGEVSLEVVQKAVALVREATESIAAAAAVPVSTPMPAAAAGLLRVEAPATPRPSGPPRDRARVAIGIDAAVVWRAGGVDPMLALRGRVALVGGFGAVAGLAWSTSAGPGVEVVEWNGVLGVGHAWGLGDRVVVEAAVVGGVSVHRFSAQAMVEPTGGRIDPLVLVPVRLAGRPIRAIELSVWAALGASRARDHVIDDEVMWRRGAIRVEAGVGAAGRF